MSKKEKAFDLLTHKIAYWIYTILVVGSGTILKKQQNSTVRR